MERDYLTFADIVEMHSILIEQYGGSYGLRDPGSLEAAIFRPQCGYYKDVIEEAAALWESLVINHPFVDGNKRIGFAAADVFLENNGVHITLETNEIYKWFMSLMEENAFIFEEINIFLRKNTDIKNPGIYSK